MKIFRQERGFTLLEVLIVVAIIIIIAGIALPRFLGVAEQGKEARARGDLRVLQTATESYILNANALPAGGTTLETATPQIVSDFTQFVDPFSPTKASYTYAKSTGTTKKLYAWVSGGPNGTAGTVTFDETKGTATGFEADDVFVTNAKKV